MRKVIIEMILNYKIKQMVDYFLDKIETLELIELIKVDLEEGTKLALSAITMKEGHTIDEFANNEFIETLSVLRKEGNKYVCLSKAKFLKKFTRMHNIDYEALAKEFNFEIIWDTPTMFSKGKMIVSVIGTEDNLKKFIESMKSIGEIKNISFKKATYSERTILSCLTDKQRDVLLAAKKFGYYTYPRKINSEELSKKVGLSKPTVVQHLRKAEVRIISNILAGY